MSSTKKRITLTLSHRQIEIAEELMAAKAQSSIPHLLRYCLSIVYDKYDSGRYRSASPRKEKKPDPINDLSQTELCEMVGGRLEDGRCNLYFPDNENNFVSHVAWGRDGLREQARRFIDNGMSWKNLMGNDEGEVRPTRELEDENNND